MILEKTAQPPQSRRKTKVISQKLNKPDEKLLLMQYAEAIRTCKEVKNQLLKFLPKAMSKAPPADADKDSKKRKRKDVDTSSSKKGKTQSKSSKAAKALTEPSAIDKAIEDEELSQYDATVNAEKDPVTFDDLIGSTVDFTKFAQHCLKKDKLMKAYLKGPAFKLLKGNYRNYIELEYSMEQLCITSTWATTIETCQKELGLKRIRKEQLQLVLVSDSIDRLVPSCFVIFDLEPLSLSFDFDRLKGSTTTVRVNQIVTIFLIKPSNSFPGTSLIHIEVAPSFLSVEPV
ncbi:hypothetical protein Tco_0067105 [Tanacetum coccineum]